MPTTGLQALILCGPGSSFPTFTSNPDENPKALLPIANRPMVWYPIDFCYRTGITGKRTHLHSLRNPSLMKMSGPTTLRRVHHHYIYNIHICLSKCRVMLTHSRYHTHMSPFSCWCYHHGIKHKSIPHGSTSSPSRSCGAYWSRPKYGYRRDTATARNSRAHHL